MKKILFLCLTALCCSFISCGDDDEPKVSNGDGQVNATLKETANQLVLTYGISESGFSMTTIWTCDFQNDKCVSSTMTQTYPTAELAKIAYDALDAETKRTAKLDGRSVIIDMTYLYQGIDRATIKASMEQLKNNPQGGSGTPVIPDNPNGPNNPNTPDNPNNPDNPNTPTPVASASITETATQLVLTFSFTEEYAVTGKWTCDFNADDMCIKSVQQMTYPSEEIAAQELRELQAEAEEVGDDTTEYWRDGKTVFSDDSADYADTSRDEIRLFMQMMKNEITGGGSGTGEGVKAWKSFK